MINIFTIIIASNNVILSATLYLLFSVFGMSRNLVDYFKNKVS